jgi:hypothetical protein
MTGWVKPMTRPENPKPHDKPKHRKHVLRGAVSPTSRRRLLAHQRHLKAIELRIGGASYEQIAQALGYANRSCALNAIRLGMIEQRRETSSRLRKIENARLDRLWLAMFPLAQRGDVRAAAVCVRICKRRSELEGLDRREKLDILGKVQLKDPPFKVYAGFDPASVVAPSENGEQVQRKTPSPNQS